MSAKTLHWLKNKSTGGVLAGGARRQEGILLRPAHLRLSILSFEHHVHYCRMGNTTDLQEAHMCAALNKKVVLILNRAGQDEIARPDTSATPSIRRLWAQALGSSKPATMGLGKRGPETEHRCEHPNREM